MHEQGPTDGAYQMHLSGHYAKAGKHALPRNALAISMYER
jgi:hypothetical protein